MNESVFDRALNNITTGMNEAIPRRMRPTVNEGSTPRTYHVTAGTVQPVITSRGGEDGSKLWSMHFGLPQHDKSKPVITTRTKASVEPILDALNNGSMSEQEAEIALRRIN